MFAYIYHVVLIVGILSAGAALAADGDVVYSAPYISVDPETGKLVTINPGPQMKMHDAQVPGLDTAVNDPATVNTAIAGSPSVGSPDNIITEAQGMPLSTIAGATLLAFIVAGLGVWKLKQKQSITTP